MSRIVYVNGRYRPHARASVHVEDRGYQFADGVYEVIAVCGSRFVDLRPHLGRLARSLAALDISAPLSDRALVHVIEEVRRRNRVRDGMVYVQVTRGVSRRDHGFPGDTKPSVVITSRSLAVDPSLARRGCDVVTVEDIRWRRCDIKSIALLPNVLAKQHARRSGGFEALQVDSSGVVTEGSSTNIWMVNSDETVITHPTGPKILDGITRRAVLEIARSEGITVEERPFSLADARGAAEVFLTSTTARIVPVRRLDGALIGDGNPGPVTRALMTAYGKHVENASRPSTDRFAAIGSADEKGSVGCHG